MAANPSFDWIDTPNPTLRGFTITAKEDTSDTIPDFLNATVLWSDCPKWIKSAEVVPPSLQGYRLIHSAKAGFQMRQFVFAPTLAREAAQTPFHSYYETEPSMYWPKVLLSYQQYKRVENDTYIIRPRYKEAYQGPTRVLIEEFYSPTPFEIPLYEPMQERGLNEEIGLSFSYPMPPGDGTVYWLSVGTLNLDSCLHFAINITLPLDPPLTIGVINYTSAYLTDTATNYEDWPETLVIDDRPREVLGGWVRRRVTALRPMIVRVTLPTSTDYGTPGTGATLGGTVAIQDNAVVTSRGVVYALTSLDANPEVGNSNATSASTTGTTGTFTLAVTGLTAGVAYSFKPWALTSQGVRVYGPVGTFTTTVASPTAPTVTTPTSADLTDDTATLGGNVTSDGLALITARGVVYSLTATNPSPQIGGTGVTNVAGTGTTGVFTVNVTGLTDTSNYSFAAYATNAVGTTYSSVGTFITSAP